MSAPLRFSLCFIFMFSLTFSQTESSEQFKFAWLTDTHVGALTGEQDLRIVVNDINTLDSIDFVIVSGDISELDVRPHLTVAKRILDSLNVPYHIIPGNHDTKWSSSGGGLFEQLWGSDRFNFEVGEFRFIGHHQGPLMRMGAGYSDPDDIAWIDSILTSLPDPRQKIFMVQHYPLDTSIDNWYAVQDVIRPYNIQAILHGHGHANRVKSYEGITGIMSRSILRRKQQPTGYSIVELKPDVAEFYERVPLADSLHFWHSLALGDRDFTDSTRLPYPDYSQNNKSGVKEVWQQATGSLITSAPTVADGQVYVSTTKGTVLAYDLDSGNELWSWQGAGAIHSTPAVKGSRVVIGGVDSSITCLATRDGRQLWQTHTTDPVLGSPLIVGRQVYVGSGDGIMRALNLRNGKIKWTSTDIDGYIETRPVVADKKIMFGAWGGAFYALNLKNGELAWKWSNPKPGLLYSAAACWPVVSDSKVFIVAPDRALSAIDIHTGDTVWRKTGHKVRESIGLSEDGKTVFARTMWDSVMAVESTVDAFKLNWITHAGFGFDIAPNAIVEADGHAFVATDNGSVYCFDSPTGAVLWQHRVSDGLLNTLAVLDGNRVVCTGTDGKVTLLEYQPL